MMVGHDRISWKTGTTDHGSVRLLGPPPARARRPRPARVPRKRNGLGSLDRASMKVNADGSVDLYFGPDAPAGFESNWLPTTGKKPYLWFRLYAPAEAFWDKSFVLPDVERAG
jgi:hypothetical protein